MKLHHFNLWFIFSYNVSIANGWLCITCFIADSFTVCHSFPDCHPPLCFWSKIKKQVCLNSACIFDWWCHLCLVWIKMCLYFFFFDDCFHVHQAWPLLFHCFISLFLFYICREKRLTCFKDIYLTKREITLDFMWEKSRYCRKYFHSFYLSSFHHILTP